MINNNEVIIMGFLKNFFGETELDTTEENTNRVEYRKEDTKPVKKTVDTSKSIKNGDVVLVEPLVYADAKDILDSVKANKVLIINLTKLDLKTGDRLLDFISGGIYALDAKLKTIGDEIYLCVPKGIELSGEFTEGEL